MQYEVLLKSRAMKDLRHIQKDDASRISDAVEKLENNLAGDVKKVNELHS